MPASFFTMVTPLCWHSAGSGTILLFRKKFPCSLKLGVSPLPSKQRLDRQTLGSTEAASEATQSRRHSSLGSFLVCAYSHVAREWAVPTSKVYAHNLSLDHVDVFSRARDSP